MNSVEQVKLLTPEQIAVVVDYQDKIDNLFTFTTWLLMMSSILIILLLLNYLLDKVKHHKNKDEYIIGSLVFLCCYLFSLYYYGGFYIPNKQIDLLKEQRNYIASIVNKDVYEQLVIKDNIKYMTLGRYFKIGNDDVEVFNQNVFESSFVINYNRNVLCYLKNYNMTKCPQYYDAHVINNGDKIKELIKEQHK